MDSGICGENSCSASALDIELYGTGNISTFQFTAEDARNTARERLRNRFGLKDFWVLVAGTVVCARIGFPDSTRSMMAANECQNDFSCLTS